MNFIEIFKGAIQCLRGNKMRSFLTMLGIIIGISSVIAMSGIGKGGERKITGSLAKSGFGVYEIKVDNEADSYRSIHELEGSDVKLLKESGIEIEAVAPRVFERVNFKGENKRDLRGAIYGTDIDFEIIEEINYIAGRPILRSEAENKIPVMVMDHVTAGRLFPHLSSPIGESVRVEFRRLKVVREFILVGIFEHPEAGLSEAGLARWLPAYGRISVPLLGRVTGEDEYSGILIKPENPLEAQKVLGEAISLLEERNSQGIYEYEERVARGSSFREILSTLSLFVTFVASISLFVGGIGVMNIMLVSVTERIREIGIRKAIGAKNIHILMQFLTEAIVLSLTGGVLGVALGYFMAEVIGSFIDIDPIISLDIVIISLFISTGIGLIFGVYPARKASLMNPIDALRTE